MRIGIFGGDTAGRTIDDVVEQAREAEADGFASYSLPQIFALDAMGVLAIVGREVPNIKLATGVVPTYSRHPMTMAQQALTVQAASGGRFMLGIGLSHQMVIENMFGLSFDKPLRHMREYLSVLMPLLHERSVSVQGRDDQRAGGARRLRRRAATRARRRARSEDARARGQGRGRHGDVDDRTGDARVAHGADDHGRRRRGRAAGAGSVHRASRSA